MVQKVQKTDDATQLQVIDEVVRISGQIPMVEKIRKTGETTQMDMPDGHTETGSNHRERGRVTVADRN